MTKILDDYAIVSLVMATETRKVRILTPTSIASSALKDSHLLTLCHNKRVVLVRRDVMRIYLLVLPAPLVRLGNMEDSSASLTSAAAETAAWAPTHQRRGRAAAQPANPERTRTGRGK